jgi:hypothetical protein
MDEPRWAGFTLALIFVPAPPGDRDLRSRLIATGIQHTGDRVENAIPALLESHGRQHARHRRRHHRPDLAQPLLERLA